MQLHPRMGRQQARRRQRRQGRPASLQPMAAPPGSERPWRRAAAAEGVADTASSGVGAAEIKPQAAVDSRAAGAHGNGRSGC